MRKYLNKLLRLVVGVSILLFLIFRIGPSEIGEAFRSFSYQYVALIIILYFFGSALGTFNLAILLLPLKHYIPFVRLLKYYFLSWGLGLVIPGKLGELSIVYFLRLEGLTVGKGSAVSLLDKLITLFTLTILSTFALLIYFTWPLFFLFMGLLVIATGLFYVFVLWDKGRAFIKDKVFRKNHYIFRGFSKTVKLLLSRHKRIIYLNFGLTALKLALHATVVLLLFKSFGDSAGFLKIYVIGAAITLVSLVPITVNGLGVKESVAVFLYSKIGIAPEVVIGTYLIIIILSYLLASTFATIFWSDIIKLVRTVKHGVGKTLKG